jgi:hypothetical protein
MTATKLYRKESLARINKYNELILGRAELAKALGVKGNTISMRIANYTELLPPIYTNLKCGPIWLKSAVKDWLQTV